MRRLHNYRSRSFLIFFVLASVSTANAGQPMPGRELNNQSASVQMVAGAEKSSSWWPEWKMPSMPWTSQEKPRVTSYPVRTPTTWEKMSRSTKSFWSKTVDILDPYPEPKPATSASDKKPLFGSWFSKEEPKKIEDVSDFLKQPQVR